MTVMYSKGTSTYTQRHALTVIAQDSEAYVLRPDGQRDDAMSRRLLRLAELRGTPDSAIGWIELFGLNLSTIALSPPQEAATVEDAVTEAAA